MSARPPVPASGHRLTFRLADRSLRQTNPVLGVAARLLELADSRLTASEVLDLVAMPPVRRRFRLDDDALERVGDWVRRAGVRWGLDADARGEYGLRGVAQNTWASGLDRILIGVAMDEEGLRVIGRRCRSTTSTPPRSTWPAGSPSWSTGSTWRWSR